MGADFDALLAVSGRVHRSLRAGEISIRRGQSSPMTQLCSMMVLLSPWRGPALRRSAARAALDIPLGVVFGIGVGLLVGLSIGFAVSFVIAIPARWLTLQLAAQCGRFERARAAALLDLKLPSPHRLLALGRWWSRPYRMLATASR
jgi:hypothetical protein